MTKSEFTLLENYMLSCLQGQIRDNAHDPEHIYRVLYTAIDIAQHENDVDMDVIITACLLHDIGRPDQLADPKLCHAVVGAEKAYKFLLDNGYSEEFAEKIRHCIKTHRFRAGDPPASIEAKILFDADKIDCSGALGIARTLLYKAQFCEKIYSLTEDGNISDGTDDVNPSFFQEYKYKLENIYTKFFTKRGQEIALKRRSAASEFYGSLLNEVTEFRNEGNEYITGNLR